LIGPGDNDWNECFGYDITSNADPIREVWRKMFAEVNTSPFNQFTSDFPQTFGFNGADRPVINRKDFNPEIF